MEPWCNMAEKDEVKYMITLKNDDRSLNILEIACDRNNQRITHIKNIVSRPEETKSSEN